MNSAVGMNGKSVSVGDHCTVHGAVTTIAGSGVGKPALTTMATDAVVVTTILGDQVNLQAGDCHAVVEKRTGNDARSTDGFAIALNDQVVFNGLVTAKTDGPWGITGQLTVLTDFSGSSVAVSSGTVDNG